MPQPQRFGPGPLYGSVSSHLDGGLTGSSFQDDFGEVYHQHDPSLPVGPQQTVQREVMPIQDTSCSPQISSRVLPSDSGAFRSPGGSSAGTTVPSQRYRGSSLPVMDAPGMSLGSGPESDVGLYAPPQQQQQQHMNNLRNVQMQPSGQTHRMNQMGKLGPMGNRMGQMNAPIGYVDARPMPGGQVSSMSPMRNSGLPSMVQVGYNDISQAQAQHRQRQMNLYQREAAVYGNENIGIMGGLNGSMP